MPRTYKPKKNPIEKQKKLDEAIRKINENKMSIRKAAADPEVGISYSTLQAYIKRIGTSKEGTRKAGNPLNIPEDSENELAACLKTMAKWGFGLSRSDIKDVVATFVTVNKMGTTSLSVYLRKYCRFKNNIPGEDWISAFLARHHLSSKKPSTLEKARVVATSDPFLIFEFYDLLEDEMKSLNLTNKPSHIYNLDETSLYLDPSRTKCVGEKGTKVARVTATSGRESCTVMACVSADGKKHSPLIIFTGKKPQSTWRGQNVDPNITLAVSDNGWMTTEIFDKWFDIFCKQVTKRPLLLIYDGHKTHMSLDLITRACSENISIIKLPAHTTDVLQPLDKCCFKPLKNEWDKQLVQNQRFSCAQRITKGRFIELVDKVWPIALTEENIMSGFKSTGIFPIDRTKYPQKRFAPQMLASYNLQYSPSKVLYSRASFPNNVNVPLFTLPNEPQPSTSTVQSFISSEQSSLITQFSTAFSAQSSIPLLDKPTSPSVMFEDLLSQRLRQAPRAVRSETRRRIDTNSAVITHDTFLQLIEDNRKEKYAKLKGKGAKNKSTIGKKTKKDKENSDDESAELCPTLQKHKKTEYDDTSEESSESNDEDKIEQLSRGDSLQEIKVKLKHIKNQVKKEVYFAVYYDDIYYIGKVENIENESVHMKFLEKGAGNFRWPKRDVREKINIKYIFYGPVDLYGNDPFTVEEDNINIAYKCYKKFVSPIINV